MQKLGKRALAIQGIKGKFCGIFKGNYAANYAIFLKLI